MLIFLITILTFLMEFLLDIVTAPENLLTECIDSGAENDTFLNSSVKGRYADSLDKYRLLYARFPKRHDGLRSRT
tara:strand:+ start:516 stop:740 length:225 start_codon:yes stop_codon:yes gene_type:complete